MSSVLVAADKILDTTLVSTDNRYGRRRRFVSYILHCVMVGAHMAALTAGVRPDASTAACSSPACGVFFGAIA